jgi:cysteine desulfurase / selenocysteine lyase
MSEHARERAGGHGFRDPQSRTPASQPWSVSMTPATTRAKRAPARAKRSSQNGRPPSADLDVRALRAAMHGLTQEMSGRRIVYLDAAGTTQRLRAAVDAMTDVHVNVNANIHQEGFPLARQAAKRHDEARQAVAKYVNARRPEEVIWVHGTTEGTNLLMTTWGIANVKRGDNIVLSVHEHLSNLLPWQLLSKRTGCELRFIDCDADGYLRLEQLPELITRRTRLVAVSHVSNALGTINPVREIARRARKVGACMLVDGAQSAPHLEIDVRTLGCDFFVFSGHKMLGPFGTGAMWARHGLLEEMPPYNVGGGSTESATLKRAEYTDPPKKFEGGTDNPAGAVGMAAAADFLRNAGQKKLWAYEQGLVAHGIERLLAIPGLRLLGPTDPSQRVPLFAFTLEGYGGKELAAKLGNRGIAVSGGDLNAGPALKRFGLEEVTRASCHVYNTTDELDALAEALEGLSKAQRRATSG